MSTGSSDTRPFGRWFQVRWAERLGDPERPYLIRWTLILFGFSIRLHHWLRSDDRRFFHDHSADLLSIVLRGKYWNVTPFDPTLPPPGNCRPVLVEGLFNSWWNVRHWRMSIWFSKAEQLHYLEIPEPGGVDPALRGQTAPQMGILRPPEGRDESPQDAAA